MKIIVIGASGTIGRAVSEELSQRHDVIRVGRTRGDYQVDITSQESVEALFAQTGEVDAIVSTTGNLHFGPLSTMTDSQFNLGLQGFVRAAACELPRGIRINLISPTVLSESLAAYGDFFPGFPSVPAAAVAQAYRRSIEGVQTGRIYPVGY